MTDEKLVRLNSTYIPKRSTFGLEYGGTYMIVDLPIFFGRLVGKKNIPYIYPMG